MPAYWNSVRRSLLLAGIVVGFLTSGHTQSPEEVTNVIPTRPGFTNPTDTVPPGDLQFEFGMTRQILRATENGTGFNGTYTAGITRKLDMYWSSDHVLTWHSAEGNEVGSGDNWIGGHYRFTEQSKRWPSLGVMYQLKLPTSSPTKNLGSGYADHTLALLFSKDIGKTRGDWNLVQNGIGSSAGLQSSTLASLALSRPIRRQLGGMVEAYGGRCTDGSGVASLLAALAWGWNKKVVVDAGVEFGLTQGAPRNRVLVGVTYSVTRFPWGRATELAAMVRH